MSTPPDGEVQPKDELSGWKEIAAYVGKGVRTVQRWERLVGLPVRRIRTPEGQIVFGSRQEIDAWRARVKTLPPELDASETEEETAAQNELAAAPSPTLPPVPPATPSGNRFRQIVLVGLAVLLVAAAVSQTRLFSKPPTPPAAMVLVGRNLEARDTAGRVLWTHPFDSEVSRAREVRERVSLADDRSAEVDLDGDGTVEHLVPVRFSLAAHDSSSTDALYAFAGDGRLLWSVQPDNKFSCRGETLDGPWRMRAVEVSSGPGKKRIWISYVHSTLWPSFIVEVIDGRPVLKYFQTGWIVSLAEWKTPSGTWLAAGGVINGASYDRPSIALLDPDGPPTVSPYDDPRFDCDGMPKTQPSQVMLFPNFDVAPAQGVPYLMMDTLKTVGTRLDGEMSDYAIVMINPERRVETISFADTYWGKHRLLETQGKLSHSWLFCPEATRPQEIRVQQAGSAWQHYSVIPTDRRSLPPPPRPALAK